MASKAFIRKSGVFRFIDNPVKNYPKSGLTSVARIVSRVRCVSSANAPETLTPSAVVLPVALGYATSAWVAYPCLDKLSVSLQHLRDT